MTRRHLLSVSAGILAAGLTARLSTGFAVKGGLLISATARRPSGSGRYLAFLQVEYSRPKE